MAIAAARPLAASKMAETEGFEPSIQFNPYDALAKRWFQPLTHVSGCGSRRAVAKGRARFNRGDESIIGDVRLRLDDRSRRRARAIAQAVGVAEEDRQPIVVRRGARTLHRLDVVGRLHRRERRWGGSPFGDN